MVARVCAQVRDLQQKLNARDAELHELGRLKQSLAQEQGAAAEWRERWNAQVRNCQTGLRGM